MKKTIIIDGNSLMYRAYYATSFQNIMTTSKGQPTNAIFAFYNMLAKIDLDSYDYALMAFDYGKKTLRHDLMEDYKAGRKPMPDELRAQVEYIKELSKIMGFKVYEKELIEADDIVGKLANEYQKLGYFTKIFSGDKDMLQLVDERVEVCLTKKGLSDLLINTKENFFELNQMYPNQVVDYKGLMGDTSDNLKGVTGVGAKTAIKLINEYGSLEGIYENIDQLKGKLKENLLADKDNAFLCKQIATIDQDVEIDLSVEETLYRGVDQDKLYDLFTELEFSSILKRLKRTTVIQDTEFIVVKENFDEVFSEIIKEESSEFLIEYFDANYHRASVIAVGVKTNVKTYVFTTDVFSSSKFKEYLLNSKKVVYDLKSIIVLLKRYDLEIKNVTSDLMLAAYVLDPDTKDNLYDLANKFQVNLDSDEIAYSKGVKRGFIAFDNSYDYLAKKLGAVHEIASQIELDFDQQRLLKLEQDLSYVLADMENVGILVDLNVLEDLEREFKKTLFGLEVDIYKLAGGEFNINSPKQLGEVLFERLEIPPFKKTKSGYSTSADVLNKLRAYPIVDFVLEYRKISKLLSTYVEGMRTALIDSRVHTIYKQALTATGRLSSTEPNMQNIPIKSEEGRSIRKMFVTKNTFIGLDYSQIELRVLAHLSQDQTMMEAFKNNDDIHKITAAKVRKIDLDKVSSADRRLAKAVNFGIIYGQTPYGLSEELKITMNDAKEFINEYYETYPGVKIFLDKLLEDAKETMYAKTILNRRRYINEINSSNKMVREFAYRTSMNSPIQGSAADILKLAMVKLYKSLKEKGLKSEIILQIHDELIIEVYEGELEIVSQIAKDSMEKAIELSVPLTVDYNTANNLYDLK